MHLKTKCVSCPFFKKIKKIYIFLKIIINFFFPIFVFVFSWAHSQLGYHFSDTWFFLGYLLHKKSTQNIIKCQILDNSNYDHFYGVGDFSHVYIIMHQ
jgi:hypothetical protein